MRAIGIHGAAPAGAEKTERAHASAWVPATGIAALGDDLGIRVELAGVEPEDVDLRFNHGLLTVSGTRRPGIADGDEVDFYIRERYYGAFRRVITLPEGTKASQIAAEIDNGLVEITVRNGVTASRSTRIALADRSDGPTSRSIGDRG